MADIKRKKLKHKILELRYLGYLLTEDIVYW